MPKLAQVFEVSHVLQQKWRREARQGGSADDYGSDIGLPSAAVVDEFDRIAQTVKDGGDPALVKNAPYPVHIEPGRTIREKKSADKEDWVLHAEQFAAAQNNAGTPPPGLPYYGFATFAEFRHTVAIYSARNCVGFRTRHSLSRAAKNKQLLQRRNGEQSAGSGHGPTWLLPDTFSDFEVNPVCVHGAVQTGRGEGQRSRGYSRYTGCKARINGQARRDAGSGMWYVQVIQEIYVHNHSLSDDVFDTYWTTSAIPDGVLFREARQAVELSCDPKQIRAYISREMGMTYSRQKWDNLKMHRIGGVEVHAGFCLLLERFAALDGSRTLLIEDELDTICGIALQSRIQREMFLLWSDSLVLDWTHNMNNVGLHMGALVITSASGRGMSVLDYLCNAQSFAIMNTIFEFFVEHNPGSRVKVKTAVIDRDFRELKSIEVSFPNAEVLLCTFDVLKWLKFVVTVHKYELIDPVRGQVVQCLRRMVFASSLSTFTLQQLVLKSLLSPGTIAGHAEFISYMGCWWYPFVAMWSMFRRGRTFTAMNTTTNRIESHWNQYKLQNGKRRRIDTCIQTIFSQAVSSLQREAELFGEHLAGGHAYTTAPPFLRRVLRVLSKYSAMTVVREWAKYLLLRSRTSVVDELGSDEVSVLRVTGVRTVDFTVNTVSWSCTCYHYCGGHLPYRHLIFAARDVKKLVEYPTLAIPARWCMSDAPRMVTTLKRAVSELETVTTARAATASESDEGLITSRPGLHIPTFKSVETVRLRRGERSTTPVMTDLQKRAAVMSVLDPLITLMMVQGTAVFASRLLELGPVVQNMITRIREPRPELSEPVSTEPVRKNGAVERQLLVADHDAGDCGGGPSVSAEPDVAPDVAGVSCDDAATRARTSPPGFVATDLDDDGIDLEEWKAFLVADGDDDEIEWDEDDEHLEHEELHIDQFDSSDMGIYESSQNSSLFPSQNSLLMVSQVSSQPLVQPLELLSPGVVGAVRFQTHADDRAHAVSSTSMSAPLLRGVSTRGATSTAESTLYSLLYDDPDDTDDCPPKRSTTPVVPKPTVAVASTRMPVADSKQDTPSRNTRLSKRKRDSLTLPL